MQAVTKARPIPEGYSSVTPYLIVEGAPRLIEFLTRTFNAEERVRMNSPKGFVSHAEMKIGDSIIMLSDATPEYKPTSSQLYVYVDNVDAVYKRALEAGGISVSEPKDQFYGDRSAAVKDPFGNTWGIATHVEDVPPDENAAAHERTGKSVTVHRLTPAISKTTVTGSQAGLGPS